jgi:hypothetical protein
MHRTLPNIGWACSFSSVLLAFLCASSGIHAFLAGEYSNTGLSGPYDGLLFHRTVVKVVAIFVIWAAPLVWSGVVVFRFSWEMVQTYLLQLLVFALGWCLTFAAANLVQISPADGMFAL